MRISDWSSDVCSSDLWQHACTRAEVLAAIRQGMQIVDARSQGRYRGDEPEPRPGLRRGHIPGSRNLPYTKLLDSVYGTLRLEERRVGQECVRTCRSRRSPIHSKKTNNH